MNCDVCSNLDISEVRLRGSSLRRVVVFRRVESAKNRIASSHCLVDLICRPPLVRDRRYRVVAIPGAPVATNYRLEQKSRSGSERVPALAFNILLEACDTAESSIRGKALLAGASKSKFSA
jgi:hypothetical protein